MTGTATTTYSGTKTITSDNTSGSNHRLQETGRGGGIRTFTCSNTTTYTTTDITNNSPNWSMTEAALDAHWGTEMTYDYYLNEHNRNSIDNNGFRLDNYVHYGNNVSQASWDGQRMRYGDGPGNSTPYTSIEIIGHEITHGLTEKTAGLIYKQESGALSESFSDIFGVSIDFVSRPGTANWEIGEEIGPKIRDMDNPNTVGHPDTYFGTNWASLSGGDRGGVHTNSSIQNLWFALLTDGGSGTNDNNDSYAVNSIGLKDAGRVAFRNLTVYLTPSSGYIDARFYSIKAAADLFGSCSNEVKEVTNAWYAVGVGPEYVTNVLSDFNASIISSGCLPTQVNFDNLSSNGINYFWDFGDGNTSTEDFPSNVYTSFGTYSVKLITDGGNCGKDSITKTAHIVIDSTMFCSLILPTSGKLTKTNCAGRIYDSGGPSGKYSSGEHVEITISPVGAASVDLTFSNFDIESNCNYDYIALFNGPNSNYPLIGKYCNSNIPTTVSSTRSEITIVFHTNEWVEQSGFQIDWQCQMPIQKPTADFTVNSTTSCKGFVNFTDLSINGANEWLWDFGDGNTSTLQDPTHTYTTNGAYTVQLKASNTFGNDTKVKTNYINVDVDAPCIINMPKNGVAEIQTACDGILYDSGGSSGEYSEQEEGEVTIAPTGADNIDLTFYNIDIDGSTSSCPWDYLKVFDGPNSTSSPLIGTYCNSNVPTSLSSTGPSITLTFTSNIFTNGNGFQVNWQCNKTITEINNLATHKKVDIVAYFNSSSNSIQLKLTNLDVGNYNLYILNSLGQVIQNKQLTVYTEMQTEAIKMVNSPKGMYYINLHNSTKNYTLKMIK